jgi:hypothetical protein
MYPDRELNRLAVHKAWLQRDIALRRSQCVVAATHASRPLAWIDRMLALWRQLPPVAHFAAGPIGFFAARKIFPRLKIIGPLLRWGPLLFSAVRGFMNARAHAKAAAAAGVNGQA